MLNLPDPHNSSSSHNHSNLRSHNIHYSPYSDEDIEQFVCESLPDGVLVRRIDSHLRSKHEKSWSSANLEIVVVHVAVRENSVIRQLESWRQSVEERLQIGVIVNPSKNFQDIGASFAPYTIDGVRIARGSILPAVTRVIHGEVEPTFEESRPYFALKKPAIDFSEREIFAFDSKDTVYPEDLFYVEPANNHGALRLYGFYPDMTRYIPRDMDSPQTRYLLRVAVNVFTQRSMMRPISHKLMELMSFIEGETRFAWGIVTEIDSKGRLLMRPKVLPFRVRNHGSYQPGRNQVRDELHMEASAQEQYDRLFEVCRILSNKEPKSIGSVMTKLNIQCKQFIGRFLAEHNMPTITKVRHSPQRYHRRHFLERIKKAGMEASSQDFLTSKAFSALIRRLRAEGNGQLAAEVLESFMPHTRHSVCDDGHVGMIGRHHLSMKCNPYGWASHCQLSSVLHGTKPLNRMQLYSIHHRVSEQEELSRWNGKRMEAYEEIRKAFGPSSSTFGIAWPVREYRDDCMIVKIAGFSKYAHLRLQPGELEIVRALAKEPIPIRFEHYHLSDERIIVSLNHSSLPGDSKEEIGC